MEFPVPGAGSLQNPYLEVLGRRRDPSSIGLFILPIISVAVSYLSMKVSMATNQMNSQTKNAQMDQTNKMMMWMMPLMSLWIGFTVPAGLSIYWIAQYLRR